MKLSDNVTLPRFALLAAFVLLCVTSSWVALGAVVLAAGLVAQEQEHQRVNRDLAEQLEMLALRADQFDTQFEVLDESIKDLPQLREILTRVKNRGETR